MVLREMNYDVETFSYDWKNPGRDSSFGNLIVGMLQSGRYGIVFSFNFFPEISRACHSCGVPYVSWIFDSPHYLLGSKEAGNDVNSIFIFDRALYMKIRQSGNNRVHYMPLAVNGKRIRMLTGDPEKQPFYEHEVCFLGSLYDNEFNFYDCCSEFLTKDLRSYLEKVFAETEQMFGRDLIGDKSVLPDEMISQIGKVMKIEITGSYAIDSDMVIRDVLRKKVTQLERKKLLEYFGESFKVDLYTQKNSPVVKNVFDLGRARYVDKMPGIFFKSKINLNFTMRSILSGIPLRALDIMAAGGFLMSGYQQELDEYFINGQDLVLASDPEDMKEKIAYYLVHDDERRHIAANGRSKTIENFDYRVILPRILDIAAKG